MKLAFSILGGTLLLLLAITVPAQLFNAPTQNNSDVTPNAPVIRPGGTLPVRQINAIMRTQGDLVGGVLFVSLDRTDLSSVTVNGIPLAPPSDPTSEFFFEPLRNGQAFMDAVVTFTPNELTSVTDAIRSTGLVYEALHQHLINENPQLFHYHIRGRAAATTLAAWAIRVVRATKTPLPQPKPPKFTPLPFRKMARILHGIPLVETDGCVTIFVPRRETFVIDNVVQLPTMYVCHVLTFQPLNTSGTLALAVPDYALLGAEVNPVLRFARALRYQIHCLYSQQTLEFPQEYFNHQIKTGDPLIMAREIRKVLNLTNTQ